MQTLQSFCRLIVNFDVFLYTSLKIHTYVASTYVHIYMQFEFCVPTTIILSGLQDREDMPFAP